MSDHAHAPDAPDEPQGLPAGALAVGAGEEGWRGLPQPERTLAVVEEAPPLERPQLVAWEPRLLKKPLRVGAKTVNWTAQRRTGVRTHAGLMSDEQAEAIAEPLAEIMNRHDTLRALAGRGVEMNLVISLYDYVQHTIVVAGIDAARAQRGLPPLAPPDGYSDLQRLQDELNDYRAEDAAAARPGASGLYAVDHHPEEGLT